MELTSLARSVGPGSMSPSPWAMAAVEPGTRAGCDFQRRPEGHPTRAGATSAFITAVHVGLLEALQIQGHLESWLCTSESMVKVRTSYL